MNAALAGTNPVVFFESQRLYDMGEMFEADGVPERYEIDLSQPSRTRAGGDLTMVTFGLALYTALEAADRLAADFHLESDVIDLRSANPVDYEMLLESVHRAGRVLLVSKPVECDSVDADGGVAARRDSRADPAAAQICAHNQPHGPSQCGGRASGSCALVPSPDAKPARAT
jgi:pyruvate/2-oxoglutarate/acetoin dehydrogenase E1 component